MITVVSKDNIKFELKYDTIGFVKNAEGLDVKTNALWFRIENGKWIISQERSMMKLAATIESQDSNFLKSFFNME